MVCAAMVTAGYGLTLIMARRLGATPAVTAAVVLMASPLLIGSLSARPQLVDYIAVLALALLMYELVAGRASAWILAAIGVLTVVWVNLHAASLLGVAVVGTTTVLVLIRRSTRSRVWWCFGALAVTGIGSLINPYGPGLLSQTSQVQAVSAGIVTEWAHVNPADPMHMAMLGIGLVALAVAVRRRDPVFTAALGIALVSSIIAIRLLPILVLLALPVIAMLASHPSLLRIIHRRRIVLYPAALAAIATVAVMAAASLGHVGEADPKRYSRDVVHAIPPNCKLFNSYILGGFVMLERPDVQVSVDSRNDLYGRDLVLSAIRVMDGEGDVDQALAGADCVLAAPDSGLVQVLQGHRNWQLSAQDAAAVLFVRR